MTLIKRKPRALLFALFLVILTGAGLAFGYQNRKPGNGSDGIRIITATDLHYLSPRINDKGEALQKLAAKGDGKVMAYSGEIVEAFIEQVITEKPDYLILTGDLTFNGEQISHEDLVGHLTRVEAEGIEVLIIPGNHDIAIPFAYSFKDGHAWQANSVTHEEFYELYRAFGQGEARLKDAASYSYIAEVSDQLWIAMIDVNTERNPNRIPRATLDWLESALAEARAKGATVITGTHQNVLVHNERFSDGYLMDNHSDLENLLEAYGVRYNMSGHIHIQHLALADSGLNESITGALSVSPHNFARLTIDEDQTLNYQTASVGVAEWAKAQDLTDPNLLDFAAYSRQYFHDISYRRNLGRYVDLPDLTDAELDTLANLSARINAAYFAGDVTTTLAELESDADYALWKEKGGDNPFRDYVHSFLDKPQKNENQAEFSLRE